MLTRMKNRVQGGFTLIELMIVVAIIGILAAVAIPAFVKYMRKSKTVEAIEALDKIKAGAKSYFQSDHYNSAGNLTPKFFPVAAGPTPTGGTAYCCGASSTAPKCAADAASWNIGRGWKQLKFQMSEPHYYVWSFSSAGSNKSAGFTAIAASDLDCDTTESEYRLLGSVDSEFGVIGKGPIVSNEIE